MERSVKSYAQNGKKVYTEFQYYCIGDFAGIDQFRRNWFSVVLLHHNLGASIDGVYIGRALGWDDETCGIIWSHSLALIPELHSCSNPILS